MINYPLELHPDYDCIIFDWDGTLADSIEPLSIAFNQSCDILDIPRPDINLLKKSFGNHSPIILKQLLNQDLSEEAFDAFVIKFETIFAKQYRSVPTILLPGSYAALEHLKNCGYYLCVASNAPRAVLDQGLIETKTLQLFDYTVCADEYPPKPAPLMLEKVLIQMQCVPKRTIMVGDHYNDIIAALEADIIPIGVLSGSQDREGLAHYHPRAILEDVTKLPTWLHEQ